MRFECNTAYPLYGKLVLCRTSVHVWFIGEEVELQGTTDAAKHSGDIATQKGVMTHLVLVAEL